MKHIFDKKELNGFYRYCLALTGDEQEAWDLLQNGLEKWVQHADQEVRQPEAYFKRMLRNRFIDDYRRAGRRPEQSYDDDAVVSMNARSLDDIIATRQEADAVLHHLAPEDREILYLWAVEEYTAQDIADHLEIPRGTILSRLYRLRNKIRTRVKRLRVQHGKKIQGTY